MQSLRSKTLNKSGNFMASTTAKRSNLKSSTKNEAQKLLSTATLENIEIDYIKNLQQQVYFLEMECDYLRQQVNLNGLQTQYKYDQQSRNLKAEMVHMQLEKNELEKSLNLENNEKETVQTILEQTESKLDRVDLIENYHQTHVFHTEIEENFQLERDLLMKEIEILKQQKLEAESLVLSKNTELLHTKDKLNVNSFDITHSLNHLNVTETHLENVRKDNLLLRAEINESRNQLITRDNLIKEMQAQLADPQRKFLITNELKVRNDNEHLKKELDLYKIKLIEFTNENQKLSKSLEMSLKQNEDDLLLAKKNLDLAKLSSNKSSNELENTKLMNSNLKTQIEQYKMQEKLETKNQNTLRKRIKELEDSGLSNNSVLEGMIQQLKGQLKSKQTEFDDEKALLLQENNKLLFSFKDFEKKINDLNDIIDKSQMVQKANVENSKSKESHLLTQIDEITLNLKNEKNISANLQLKIDNFQRQDQIYSNLISSLKSRVSELEVQLNEYSLNQPGLQNKLIEITEKVNSLEEENARHLSHIELLNAKLNDVDRLKKLEDLVQSQRWSELGALAESMKHLSSTMGSTANFNATTQISSIDETLRNSLKF